eukprot:7110439-Prymnesium_polylepis.1
MRGERTAPWHRARKHAPAAPRGGSTFSGHCSPECNKRKSRTRVSPDARTQKLEGAAAAAPGVEGHAVTTPPVKSTEVKCEAGGGGGAVGSSSSAPIKTEVKAEVRAEVKAEVEANGVPPCDSEAACVADSKKRKVGHAPCEESPPLRARPCERGRHCWYELQSALIARRSRGRRACRWSISWRPSAPPRRR